MHMRMVTGCARGCSKPQSLMWGPPVMQILPFIACDSVFLPASRQDLRKVLQGLLEGLSG